MVLFITYRTYKFTFSVHNYALRPAEWEPPPPFIIDGSEAGAILSSPAPSLTLNTYHRHRSVPVVTRSSDRPFPWLHLDRKRSTFPRYRYITYNPILSFRLVWICVPRNLLLDCIVTCNAYYDAANAGHAQKMLAWQSPWLHYLSKIFLWNFLILFFLWKICMRLNFKTRMVLLLFFSLYLWKISLF
jgi:hypothetical protein